LRAVDDASVASVVAAFPAGLRDEVAGLMRRLPPFVPVFTDLDVEVEGESLKIPYRVRGNEPSWEELAAMSEMSRTLVACLYSRHPDGHVRERHARRLVKLNEPWVVPFVFQLLSEYELEIGLMIVGEAGLLTSPAYVNFVRENPRFVNRAKQRAASYWNLYYRDRFPNLKKYPPMLAMKEATRAAMMTSKPKKRNGVEGF
jgi:hypothetical protein